MPALLQDILALAAMLLLWLVVSMAALHALGRVMGRPRAGTAPRPSRTFGHRSARTVGPPGDRRRAA